MEKLKDSLITLNKALKTLDSALKLIVVIKESSHNEQLVFACQDSIIQRFEYCYESFWKFFKLYLETVHMLETERVKSPKVFSECVPILNYAQNLKAKFLLKWQMHVTQLLICTA